MEPSKDEKKRKDTSKKNTFFKLDLAILAALNYQDCYGYEITTIIKDKTNNSFILREGVLYPILYRLCNEGKITSQNLVVHGRNRVYYHLEDSGRRYMEDLLDEYIDGQRVLNEYLVWTGCLNQDNLDEMNPWIASTKETLEILQDPHGMLDK